MFNNFKFKSRRSLYTFIIIGTDQSAQQLSQHILNSSSYMQYIGWCDFTDINSVEKINTIEYKLHLSFATLIELIRTGEVHNVYIMPDCNYTEAMNEMMNILTDSTANIYYLPPLKFLEFLTIKSTKQYQIPMFSIYDHNLQYIDCFCKRIFDIVVSLIVLVIIAIPLLLISIAIKMTSSGNILFKQHRYGLNGENIVVWKFRSMRVNEDGNHIPQAHKNDPRVTPLGAFLRRYSLDELPQFINVLQGKMSIIGPRPHAVAHNEWYRKQIKGYMLRHKVKPGITGWAQINGCRGETETIEKMQKRIEYDLFYIKHWSLWLDIKILALTIYKTFTGKLIAY